MEGSNYDILINYTWKKSRWEEQAFEFKSFASDLVTAHYSGRSAKTLVFIAVILTICLPAISQVQTDSLKRNSGENIIWYFDTGFGRNNRGLNLDMSFTVSSVKVLGASLNFMSGFVKMKDVPPDYYDGIFRWSAPINNFWDLSLDLTVKLFRPDKPVRFGFEAGPSFMRYDMVELIENPNYPDLLEYKYNKTRTMHNAFGFNCAMKAEIPALDFLGCSFILFGNINAVQSLIGLDVCICLGNVGKN